MIIKEPFGISPCGSEVYAYTLKNDSITSARITNFGGTIINLWVKNKEGKNSFNFICRINRYYWNRLNFVP